ncbi:hypothetical protein [Frankia tisae]|uniref:hypothetical protein n=1 Tax=Frankia tisae TaxID=2950104 RepID=UPI0021C15506|nr:hypothetical protein [Frankia tisae]
MVTVLHTQVAGIIVKVMSSDRGILQLQVEIVLGAEPVRGSINGQNGSRTPFSGWLQFLEAAELLRAEPPSFAPEPEGS